jgi:phenylpyruvate tautomerase PptA (4-oxalocrotonate tautomerase family)
MRWCINTFFERHTGTDPKYIYVIFEDVAPSDWAGEGKLFGGEASAAFTPS